MCIEERKSTYPQLLDRLPLILRKLLRESILWLLHLFLRFYGSRRGCFDLRLYSRQCNTHTHKGTTDADR